MKTTEYIAKKIKQIPDGQVFTYTDIAGQPGKREAVIKALNRMVAAGKLAKLAKGKYYKAEETIFGNLKPNQAETLKDLFETKGNVVGYLTGYSIYNGLGLTTQVSSFVQIGKNDTRYQFKRGPYTITFVKQKNVITSENIPLLQILDAIRYINKIPDTTFEHSFKRLFYLVKELPVSDKKILVKLLLKYPAATRALTGAMLEKSGAFQEAEKIRATLNPVTTYKIPGIEKLISNAKNWNLK